MANTRKQSIRAYILLESLIAMSLLLLLVTTVLTQLLQSRKEIQTLQREIEALNLAQMALDTGETHLQLNGVDLAIEEDTKKLVIKSSGEVILALEKD